MCYGGEAPKATLSLLPFQLGTRHRGSQPAWGAGGRGRGQHHLHRVSKHLFCLRGKVPLLRLSCWGPVTNIAILPTRYSAIQNARGLPTEEHQFRTLFIFFCHSGIRVKWHFLYRKFTWKEQTIHRTGSGPNNEQWFKNMILRWHLFPQIPLH